MNINELNAWLQHRIDYWEDVCEKHKDEPSCVTEQVIFEEGLALGEEKGFLSAFYQVQEFLTGQRK